MLSATTYLEPVAHGGGALVWWPRSHHAMHRFLSFLFDNRASAPWSKTRAAARRVR